MLIKIVFSGDEKLLIALGTVTLSIIPFVLYTNINPVFNFQIK